MAFTDNSIKVLSENCQGLRSKEKRFDVLSYLREQNASIICLQDTHWVQSDIRDLKNAWGSDIFIIGGQTNSCGVAILSSKHSEYDVLNCKEDKNSNYLNLQLKYSHSKPY